MADVGGQVATSGAQLVHLLPKQRPLWKGVGSVKSVPLKKKGAFSFPLVTVLIEISDFLVLSIKNSGALTFHLLRSSQRTNLRKPVRESSESIEAQSPLFLGVAGWERQKG